MMTVPWIAASAEVRVVPVRPGSELRQMQGAEVDCTRGIEPLENGRRNRRNPIAADERSSCGNISGAVKEVLVRERHAMKRAAGPSLRELPIEAPGSFNCLIRPKRDEAVDVRLPSFDPGEAGFGHLDR